MTQKATCSPKTSQPEITTASAYERQPEYTDHLVTAQLSALPQVSRMELLSEAVGETPLFSAAVFQLFEHKVDDTTFARLTKAIVRDYLLPQIAYIAKQRLASLKQS